MMGETYKMYFDALLLCVFGAAVIVRAALKGDPSRVTSVSCRFTSPTTPGDRLRVCMWGLNSSTVSFRVINLSKKGAVVLERGILEIEPAATDTAKL